MKKLQLLYSITEVALGKFHQININKPEEGNNLHETVNKLNRQFILWANILVEVTSLKYPSQMETQLIKTYKALPIYEKILAFNQSILEMSITKAYIESVLLIVKCLKIVESLIDKIKSINGPQLLQIQQGINKAI